MKKNESYTVTCTDITNQGYGVTRIDNQVVFVRGLLPGETAAVQIVKVLKQYAFARITELIESSAHRTVPFCPLSNRCGGCAFQHLEYKEQLKIKTGYVKSLFEKAKLDVEVLPAIGMEDPRFYRNKAQFPVCTDKENVQIGFYRPHSHSIIDCASCPIQSKAINAILAWIRQHITIREADPLRHIMIRSNEKEHVQVVFIGRQNRMQDLVSKMVKENPNVDSVIFNQNIRDDNVILGDAYEVLWQSDRMEQTCMGQSFLLHFKSFFQVNPVQTEVLYQTAIDLAQLQKDQNVVDLYSGIGTIACIIAPYVKSVTGVEIVKEAVDNARENAKRNHLDHVHFICEDATTFIQKYKEKTDVVFVDPPRKGLKEQGIEHITGLQPERIVYISCNPETLVRDAVRFEKAGYFCRNVQPVDMFCQTNGIECVSLFVKSKKVC